MVLHINVNSLHFKDIDDILKLKKIDILCVNETKLDKYKPQSFYKNSHYDLIRRDRDFDDSIKVSSGGGGVLVFVKKTVQGSIHKNV